MTGPRLLTRAQLLENAAFLRELARTGNAREAARRLGAHRAKFTKRRAKHPSFAAQWDAALTRAQETLARGHGFDPDLTRLADGRLQLQRREPCRIDADCRARFLDMLSLCGTVRFAAETEGFSHAAFCHHKARDPDFARAWRRALFAAAIGLEAEVTGRMPELTEDEAIALFGQ